MTARSAGSARAPRAPRTPRAQAVVLVHGILMAPLAMVPLQRRLRRAGFDARILAYPSVRASPAENAERLRREVQGLGHRRVHLVGHSLGGIVILHLLARSAPEHVGRTVLLGTPVAGSAVARLLAGSWLTRPLMGRSLERGLLGGAPSPAPDLAVGVISGALPFGIGHLVPGLASPHDGTVSVAETHLEAATGRLTLPVSHTGLVLSRSVADATRHFLRTGAFP